MDAEQTWPTEEEIAEAEMERKAKKKIIKKIPKGFSDYQAAWIPDCDAGIVLLFLQVVFADLLILLHVHNMFVYRGGF